MEINMKKPLFLPLFFILTLPLSLSAKQTYIYFTGGYSFAVNYSYIDTTANKDIYWNPNNGWALKAGFGIVISPIFDLRMDITGVFGYYKYPTRDGGKVNTENQVGSSPPTVNVEWSQSFNIHFTLIAKLVQKGSFIPYIGVGAGIGYLKSYETWDFINSNNQHAKLYLRKYYPIALSFSGTIGFKWMFTKNLGLIFESAFYLVNYVMKKVIIYKYTIDGVDHTNDYTLAQRTYTYHYDIPDENKGGECLLSGFNYANYPQHKIGTAFKTFLGVVYFF
jgi:hypothetical protein